MDAMLEQLHGRTAETAAGSVVVESAGARVDQLGRTLLEHLLRILANPNLALVLFLIGGVALWAEWSVPGMIGPGVVGVLALILAFVGFFNLPGNWVGLVLLALAMGLFYAETTAPGFSLFGAGGIVSFVLGSVFLFGNIFSPSDLPELNIMVSPVVIAVTSGLMAAAWVLFMRLAMHGGGVSTGFQTEEDVLLEGASGVALSDLDPAGRVKVSDKEWSASAGPGDSIREGEEVRVIGVYQGVLKVERLYRQGNG